MLCPKCSTDSFVKNGFVKNMQLYKCKGCGYHYTGLDSRGRPFAQKLLAVTLYAHGLSLNALAKWHYLQKSNKVGFGKFWIVLQESSLSGNVAIEA